MTRVWLGAVLASLILALPACGGGSGGAAPSAPTDLGVATASVAPGGQVHPRSALTIEFGQPVDAGSLTADSVVLSDGVSSVPLSVAVDGRTMTVTPSSALRLNQAYELTVRGGLRSTVGSTLPSDYRLPFSTLRIAYDVRVLVPASDLEGGGAVRPMIAVADLDGDGRQDVATVGRLRSHPTDEGYTLQLYRQGASGGVAPVQRIDKSFGFQVFSVTYPALVAIDLDLDGVVELVVAEYQPQPDAAHVDTWPLTGLRIFSRGSDGRYAESSYLRTAYVRTLDVGDVDGDGHPDLVGTHSMDSEGQVYGFRDTGYQVFLSRAGGVQALAPVSGLPDIVDAVVLADLDRDGRLDLLFGQRPGALVLRGDGHGGFSTDAERSAALAPICTDYCDTPVVIDANGDGWLDFLWTSRNRQGVVSAQDGSYGAWAALLPASSGVLSPVASDLDGDGRPDLVYVWSCATCPAYVTTLFGNDDLQFDQTQADPYEALTWVQGATRAGTAMADFDGDGRPDMLIAAENAGVVLLRTELE